MKKLFWSLSAMLFFSSNAFSQPKIAPLDDRGYVALEAGVAIPVGDFADDDFYSVSSGIASSGGVLGISFAYRLGKSLGLTAMFRGYSNPVDDQVFLDEMEKNF